VYSSYGVLTHCNLRTPPFFKPCPSFYATSGVVTADEIRRVRQKRLSETTGCTENGCAAQYQGYVPAEKKSPGHLNTPGDLDSQKLSLFDDDGVYFANLDAAFATQALFGVNGFGFPVFHFKHLSGANVNALLAANAFFLIHDRIKSHDLTPFKIIFH
jgi:hypothetical protein